MTCHNGYRPLSGWWLGACGDEARNFGWAPKHGIMRSNASAVRRLVTTGGAQGRISIETRFATDRVPDGGGQHIFSVTSAHLGLGSPRGKFYFGWLRFDFEIHHLFSGPVMQIGVYNADGMGDPWKDDIVVDEWITPLSLRAGEWQAWDFGWTRVDLETITVSLNDWFASFRIHPDSENPRAISFGNMDNLERFGGVPEVWFRDLQEWS